MKNKALHFFLPLCILFAFSNLAKAQTYLTDKYEPTNSYL